MAAGRPFRAIVGVAVVALSAGGCMLFRSLDDLASGADASLADGALPEGSAGDVAVDGGPTAEAAGDGGVDGASPCTVPHAFCDDFEREGDAATGWEQLNLTAGSTLSVGPTQGVVGTRALFSAVPLRPTVDHVTVNASLTKHLDRTINKVHVELDLYVEQPTFKASDVGLARLVLYVRGDAGFAGTVLFNDANSAALSLEQLSGNDRYFSVPAFPFGRWGHITLDLDLAGSLHFELPGGGGTRTFPAVTLGGSPHLDLTVGLTSFDGPVPEHHAYFDNVVLDVE